MIKLIRPDKPAILADKENEWLQPFLAAVDQYGGYNNIPKEEKAKLVSYYRHDQIKQTLFPSSFFKCAFCEGQPQENGNIEVEHFFPKSIYPEKIFSWENLLPACRKCNDAKMTHDPRLEPIINPYEDDPAEYFYYADIMIKPLNEDEKAKTTISVCSLNSVRLMQPRAEVLISLHLLAGSLQEALEDLAHADTVRKRQNKLRKISEGLEVMDQMTESRQRYSGYCKNYLKYCQPYHTAKVIVEISAL